MSVVTTIRQASNAEIVAEMDRRGEVIERLEARIEADAATLSNLRAENARLAAELAEARKREVAAHQNFITAWEALEEGSYRGDVIQVGWLAFSLHPAVQRARAARDFLTRTGESK